ncbi:MAG: hypothetical protein LBQ35_04305 [Spirochaetaceae bacterium]|jgi:calcineurin-like phosphoesterase family protein|nr:hypothetical protein [Spirochaetaceae bacterium]
MNAALIDNWNSVVTDDDEIYIPGDFLYRGTGRDANRILAALRGKKYLVRGNHERYLEDPDFIMPAFEWVKDYYLLYHEKRKFVLFHYPILSWDGAFHGSIHLYGHVHNNVHTSEYFNRNRAINVGADVRDFRPVSIEEIVKMADASPASP